jgi:hypothetical protein
MGFFNAFSQKLFGPYGPSGNVPPSENPNAPTTQSPPVTGAPSRHATCPHDALNPHGGTGTSEQKRTHNVTLPTNPAPGLNGPFGPSKRHQPADIPSKSSTSPDVGQHVNLATALWMLGAGKPLEEVRHFLERTGKPSAQDYQVLAERFEKLNRSPSDGPSTSAPAAPITDRPSGPVNALPVRASAGAPQAKSGAPVNKATLNPPAGVPSAHTFNKLVRTSARSSSDDGLPAEQLSVRLAIRACNITTLPSRERMGKFTAILHDTRKLPVEVWDWVLMKLAEAVRCLPDDEQPAAIGRMLDVIEDMPNKPMPAVMSELDYAANRLGMEQAAALRRRIDAMRSAHTARSEAERPARTDWEIDAERLAERAKKIATVPEPHRMAEFSATLQETQNLPENYWGKPLMKLANNAVPQLPEGERPAAIRKVLDVIGKTPNVATPELLAQLRHEATYMSAHSTELLRRIKSLGRLLPMVDRFVGEETGRAGTVIYLNESQRAAYKVHVNDGRLLDVHGQRLDTRTAGSERPENKGRAIFVMIEGHLYVAKHYATHVFQHSSLSGGACVEAAGEIVVKDGKLKFISRLSGHYRPSREHLDHAIDRLRKMGVDYPFEIDERVH